MLYIFFVYLINLIRGGGLEICGEGRYFVEKSGLVQVTCKVPGEKSKAGRAQLFFRDSTRNDQNHSVEFFVENEILQVSLQTLREIFLKDSVKC